MKSRRINLPAFLFGIICFTLLDKFINSNKMNSSKKLFIISILFLLFSLSSLSQNSYFHLDSIDDSSIILDSCWIYHPGDDTTWAAFDYPDHNWDTISTTLNLQHLDKDHFSGIGWFRLHVTIDSILMNKNYILLIEHNGASEIFHNGNLLKRSGRLGIADSSKRYINPSKLPIPIHFDNQKHHVIAVRYANKDAVEIYKKYNEEIAGFTLTISDLSLATSNLLGVSISTNIIIMIFTIFLVLGGLHLLIFLFFRDNKSNFYYSIFALFIALIIFSAYMKLAGFFNPSFVISSGYYAELLSPFVFVFLMLLVYSLFYDRIHIIFWVITAISLFTSALSFFNVSWDNVGKGILILFVFVEISRVVIRAMIKKISGAWILGTGIIMFIVFVAFIILFAMLKGDYVIQGSRTFAIIFSLLFLLAVVSIPISMSVYLARDFAKTNKNLKKQLENVKVLSAKTIEQEKEKQRILEGQKDKLEQMVTERTKELADEKDKTEQLLLNTLPLKVVNELKANGTSEPESFENVTVYFSDIVGFTNISTQLEPTELITELNQMFTAFDDIMERNHCERIKTIGDAYLAVCGMPDKQENHTELMAKSAIEICTYLEKRNQNSKIQWKVRIGLHSGKVVGGIVGVKKYIYDVFGDTINTTSRMESNSEPMRINVSETTYNLLSDKFRFTPREPMEIKGKGLMKMYFLEG